MEGCRIRSVRLALWGDARSGVLLVGGAIMMIRRAVKTSVLKKIYKILMWTEKSGNNRMADV